MEVLQSLVCPFCQPSSLFVVGRQGFCQVVDHGELLENPGVLLLPRRHEEAAPPAVYHVAREEDEAGVLLGNGRNPKRV